MKDAYENLANAVILQAVKDWRWAVKVLKKRPRYLPAKEMREDCESFFRSEWFGQLTGVDGGFLLRKLELEAGVDDE